MLRIFNAKQLSQIQKDRKEQLKEMMDNGTIEIHQAIAGLFEELLALTDRVEQLEKNLGGIDNG